MNRTVIAALALGLGLVLGAAPALAQQPSALSGLYACMGVAGDAARAACFDKAAGELKAAEAAGRLTILTPQAIEKAQVDTFGDPKAGVSAVASAVRKDAATPAGAAPAAASAMAAPPDPDRIKLGVAEIRFLPDGSLRFVMENGQVWRQIDALKLGNIGKGPWTAEIRKAALGSFLLKLNNKTAVRVKRES